MVFKSSVQQNNNISTFGNDKPSPFFAASLGKKHRFRYEFLGQNDEASRLG